MLPWDLFISHASEDKSNFVDPLANRLKDLAVRVWYDRFVLTPGDRLTEKIAEGLAQCRCGVLVLSKAFIGKPWTRYEVSGLVNRFVEEGTRLIPIWLDVARSDVAAFNPALADLFSISGSPNAIDDCAMEILRVVRPQLHENLSLLNALDRAKVTVEKRSISEVKTEGPIRHHDLAPEFLLRLQNIWFATRDVFPISLAKTIENFQKDLRPEKEATAMERLVSALNITMDILKSQDLVLRKKAWHVLISFSVGNHEDVFEKVDKGQIDEDVLTAAVYAWQNVIPPVTVSDVEDAGV